MFKNFCNDEEEMTIIKVWSAVNMTLTSCDLDQGSFGRFFFLVREKKV